MIQYKFIVAGRGEGKTKKLVDCLIDSVTQGRKCVYVGSYYNYINVRNMYESIMHSPSPLLFVDSEDKIKDQETGLNVDFFTDELTQEFGSIMLNSGIQRWASRVSDPRWYITLDKSHII